MIFGFGRGYELEIFLYSIKILGFLNYYWVKCRIYNKIMPVRIALGLLALAVISAGAYFGQNKLFNASPGNIPPSLEKLETLSSSNKSISSNNLSCPVVNYTTDKIKLIEEREIQGYKIEFYRNYAYTCSRNGYYTFVVAYPKKMSESSKQPLWVRMHGGSMGAYSEDGSYLPERYCKGGNSPCWIDEESLEKLGSYLEESGLVAEIRKRGDFRFLAPSMCDHDLYAGIGTHPEKNNPNIDANGEKPKADGLLALRSAIDYTTKKYPSSHVFAQGTSAGSFGASVLSMALSCENKNLSGAILDSGVRSRFHEQYIANGCHPEIDTRILNLGREKIVKEGEANFVDMYIDDLVKSGQMKTPLFDLFSTGDCACPGKREVSVKDQQGNSFTGTGCELMHSQLDQAIEREGRKIGSDFREVCVDQKRDPKSCSTHVSSTRSSKITGGDLLRGGEDYNKVIYDWVKKRLKDPEPKL